MLSKLKSLLPIKPSMRLKTAHTLCIIVIIAGWYCVALSNFDSLVALCFFMTSLAAVVLLGIVIYYAVVASFGRERAIKTVLAYILLVPVFFAGVVIFPLLVLSDLNRSK